MVANAEDRRDVRMSSEGSLIAANGTGLGSVRQAIVDAFNERWSRLQWAHGVLELPATHERQTKKLRRSPR